MDRIDHNGGDFHYVLEYYSSINVNPTPKRFERYQHEFKIPNAGYYHLWSYKIQGKNIVGGGPFCEGNAYSGQNGRSSIDKLLSRFSRPAYVDVELTLGVARKIYRKCSTSKFLKDLVAFVLLRI